MTSPAPPRRFTHIVAALVSVFAGTHAFASDPRNFELAPSPGAVLGLDTSWVAPPLRPSFGLGLSFANDELVIIDAAEGEDDAPLLESRFIATLTAGMTLFDTLELAVAVPFALSDGGGGATNGLGDVRVAVKARLVGPARGAAGIGLGLAFTVGLPTGDEAAFASDGGVVLDPRLLIDWRGASGAVIGLSAGYRHRPKGEIRGLVIGDEIRYGLASEIPVAALGARALPLSLIGEVEGATGLEDASNALERPFEARFGVRVRGARWALTVASGTGLSSGYGAPDFRVLAGFVWGDGPVPEPPPELGSEVVAGTSDKGPEPEYASGPNGAGAIGGGGGSGSILTIEDPDADADGVPKDRDKCPDDPEDLDNFADDDGCPELDNDVDGVLDAADKCAGEKEVVNGFQDDDGCADEPPQDPKVKDPKAAANAAKGPMIQPDGLIVLPGVIVFNPGSDVLLGAAEPVLAQIATFLLAHPEVKRLRIEGHTDDRGDKEFNVDLSERRAARVRNSLMKRGVASARLLPKGFGPTHPLVPNTTEKNRGINRRVELRIVDPPMNGTTNGATSAPANGGTP